MGRWKLKACHYLKTSIKRTDHFCIFHAFILTVFFFSSVQNTFFKKEMAERWSLFHRHRKCDLQIWSKLPKVTKLAEGRAGNQTKRFDCAAQIVTASTDIKKKKKIQGNSVFPRTNQSCPQISPTIHPTIYDIYYCRTGPLFHMHICQWTNEFNQIYKLIP